MAVRKIAFPIVFKKNDNQDSQNQTGGAPSASFAFVAIVYSFLPHSVYAFVEVRMRREGRHQSVWACMADTIKVDNNNITMRFII